MHTRDWRWYLKHHMTFRINRIWPLKERKKKSGGKKNVTVKINIKPQPGKLLLITYILFSVHMTCRASPETLTSLKGVSCSPDWTDTPALSDQAFVLLQQPHLRHTDPEKPELTVPPFGAYTRLLSISPAFYLPHSSNHHTGENVKGENPWSLQKKN